MSTLSQFFAAGGIKSIQTGFVSSTSLSTGSGEDDRFLDISISAVNTSKSVIFFDGGSGRSNSDVGARAWAIAKSTSDPANLGAVSVVTKRLTSGTNLRLASPLVASQSSNRAIVGRWTVVEFE